MNNRKIFFFGIVVLILIGLSANLNAQEQGFLLSLKSELASQGLTQQEIVQIMTEAQNRNWQGLDDEFAELAALSLRLMKRSRLHMQTQEMVELAFHLAVLGDEMKSLGFKERHIARIALNATQEYMEQTQLQEEDRNQLKTQDRIRERIRDQLGKEGLTDQEEKLMQRIHVRVRNSRKQTNNNGRFD
jgi:hypothetical protein